MGTTLVFTASPESFLRYGYVPYDRQFLGVKPYVETDLPPRISGDSGSSCGRDWEVG